MKSINNYKSYFFLALLITFAHAIVAQEVIKDNTPLVAQSKNATDSLPSKHKKVDGVAAVVGNFIVLDSDVDKAYIQLKTQGANIKDIKRCELFGKLLEDKLYEHQAIQDSVEVSDATIRRNVNYKIEQFVQQIGSMEKLLKFYKKDSERSLKEEMFQIDKSVQLASRMQAKIIENVEVTPEEVRTFFNKIPEKDRPIFGTTLKVAQIVIKPKASEEEKKRIIEKLKSFKRDVEQNGASFRSKVILYGQDPGLKKSGYTYTLSRKNPQMVKAFRDVAFSLQEGEISEPFETDFGFHIIYLKKIRGQDYIVSHILLRPKISDAALKDAKERLEAVRKRIVAGDISFADAAREVSDEKETRTEGGQLINPKTQDYNFELTEMDPELYGQIENLKTDKISPVLSERTRTGDIRFKILKVTDRVDEHKADYARDFLKIKNLALQEKRIKTIKKWQAQKIKETYVRINGSYRDCQFASNWLKK